MIPDNKKPAEAGFARLTGDPGTSGRNSAASQRAVSGSAAGSMPAVANSRASHDEFTGIDLASLFHASAPPIVRFFSNESVIIHYINGPVSDDAQRTDTGRVHDAGHPCPGPICHTFNMAA